jgi:hypothetical protein
MVMAKKKILIVSENNPKIVKIPSVKNDRLLYINLENIYSASDDYVNWVNK